MQGESAASGQGLTRGVIATLAALAASVGVAAVELNRQPDGQRPALARALWPSYPDAVRDDAMRAIGLAAARGGAVPVGAREAMLELARNAPLRPEPFLVEATVSATAGDGAKAEQLFSEAEARDPRSILAHYALADRALRTNHLTAALSQISMLVRLVPQAAASLTGPIALYARNPGTELVLRDFFTRSPAMASPVLAELAKDPVEADRAIALSRNLAPGADRGWQQTLVQTLVDHGEYAHALAAWRKLNGVAPYSGLFNPQFRLMSALPPFNWSPWQDSAALVEGTPGGGLKVVYYGRADALITRQLIALAPGRYQLAMSIGGGPLSTASSAYADQEASLAWRVICADGGAALGTLPIDSSGRASLDFAVPAACRAQWLSLSGTASSYGEPVSLTISGLTLHVGHAG